MRVTPLGIFMLARLVHPTKAYEPIAVMQSGSDTLVISVHLPKAASSISITDFPPIVSGIYTLPPLPLYFVILIPPSTTSISKSNSRF